jgi:hypothetical protein
MSSADITLRLKHFANLQRKGDLQNILVEAVSVIESMQNWKAIWAEHNIAYNHLYTAYQAALFRADPSGKKIVQYELAKQEISEWKKQKKAEVLHQINKRLKADLRGDTDVAKLPGFYWAPRFRGRRRMVLRSVDRGVEQRDGPDSQEIPVPTL